MRGLDDLAAALRLHPRKFCTMLVGVGAWHSHYKILELLNNLGGIPSAPVWRFFCASLPSFSGYVGCVGHTKP